MIIRTIATLAAMMTVMLIAGCQRRPAPIR